MRFATLATLSLTVSALAIAAPVMAQSAGTGTQTIAQDGQTGDPQTDVVVTGSRVPGRTAANSPVPIDVIGGDQLKNSGYTETNKLLNQLVPSFNFPQPSLTDGTDSLRPATLRGLAPDQTLVLINGKRRHTSALVNLNGSVGRGSSAVDLNEIPPIAIDRIEVLRDGASSQYGSDAIAGVINLQLSKAVGATGSVTYGKYDTTMSGVRQVTGVAVGANGLPIVAVAGGGNGDILQLNDNGRDRHVVDGQTVTTAVRLGLPVTDGYFVFSGQFRDRQPTNRSGFDPRRQYNFTTAGDPRELTVNRLNHRYGDGHTDDFNFFLNAGHDLGAGFEVYAFGSYGLRDGDGAGFFRRSNDVRNRNFSASTTTFVPYYADGFLPIINSVIRDAAGAVGVRGDLGGGWKEDLSVVYGTDKLGYQVSNSLNTSLGAQSPNKFNAGSLAFGQTTVNLDLSKKYDVGFLDSFGVAVGAEYRNENFKIRAGDANSYINGPFSAAPFNAAGGAQVFPGFRPNNAVDVSRDSFAGYAEADADISSSFTVQVAGRYEHFSDFGSTVNGKAAARFEPIRGVAIRGSVSTGFRAPSLQQQYFATTSTNNTVVNGVAQLIEVGTFPATSPVATALGGKALKAEKATNLAGGVALTPITGLSLTIDYYNIKIRDRVVLTENLTGAAVVGLLGAQGITNVTSARFFVNGVNTRTQGVDVVGSYRVPDFGYGKVVLTAGFNYNDTTITRRASLPSLPGVILFGRTESYRLTDGQPRTKLNLSADYDYGPVGLTLRTNRYGSVFIAGTGGDPSLPKGAIAGDYTLTPKFVSDVELRVHPYQHIDLAIGANNVFDVYPRRVPLGGAFAPNSYFLPYSSLSPFGFNGRFLYARAAFSF